MIITVTLNPAIDYVIRVSQLQQGKINRTEEEFLRPGGKGINVSLTLKQLGIESVALGFIAGFTGSALEQLVAEQGVATEFVKCAGSTRINVKIRSDEETDFNGKGIALKTGDLERLMKKLLVLQDGDYLVLSGSIPPGVPENAYAKILRRVSKKNLNIVVDATGGALRNTLPHHPFLLKPNREEICEFFHTELNTQDEFFDCARKLQELGARNVIVSLANDGALMLTEMGERLVCNAPSGIVVDSVGAGDSLIAGFLASYTIDEDYAKALRFGVAAGSATAFSHWLGDRRFTEQLMMQTELFRLQPKK